MLKAGFAKVDVTPPLGSPMAGYARERISDGILDPIELVALAVNDGENTALIITADFLGMWETWATEIRDLISKETGAPAECVYIQCLHPHTSVRIGWNLNVRKEMIANRFVDDVYYNMLYRKFVDVSKMAIDNLCEAEMSVAEQETAEKLAFIRRFRMKDGSTKTNPQRDELDQVEGPIGQADNTVRLVRFKREGAKDIALVNFSTHPDVIGKTKFSADWPGFVRRITEADIPNTHCIFVNGAEGDSNHINRFEDPPKMKQFGYAYSAHMGRVITNAVMKMWDNTTKKEVTKVSGQIRMNYIPTNTSLIDEVEKYQKLKDACRAGTYTPADMEEYADIFRAAELRTQPLFQKVPLTVIGIGDVALVGYGGEPFTQYAADVRAEHPELFVIATCNTNGEAGYLPTKEAFAEGGYESKSSNFTPELSDILQRAVKEMLATINK